MNRLLCSIKLSKSKVKTFVLYARNPNIVFIVEVNGVLNIAVKISVKLDSGTFDNVLGVNGVLVLGVLTRSCINSTNAVRGVNSLVTIIVCRADVTDKRCNEDYRKNGEHNIKCLGKNILLTSCKFHCFFTPLFCVLDGERIAL